MLRGGNIVAMPSETVYGLAANALDEQAVNRIFVAKGRPQDNPLIVHLSDARQVGEVARDIGGDVQKLAGAFWPGPLTLVLPDKGVVAPNVTAGLGTVAVRVPANAMARKLIEQAGFPLAAPSANRSGSPSPTTVRHVLDDMSGRIPAVLDGGSCAIGIESTVLSLVCAIPEVLRPGFVTPDEIAQVLGRPVRLSAYVEKAPGGKAIAHSPGVKYKHYAPKADITIILSDDDDYYAHMALIQRQNPGAYALCFTEDVPHVPLPSVSFGSREAPEEQAARLFSALRLLDEKGAKTVYARLPAAHGVGLAVRNRLLRAASFRVVDLMNHARGKR